MSWWLFFVFLRLLLRLLLLHLHPPRTFTTYFVAIEVSPVIVLSLFIIQTAVGDVDALGGCWEVSLEEGHLPRDRATPPRVVFPRRIYSLCEPLLPGSGRGETRIYHIGPKCTERPLRRDTAPLRSEGDVHTEPLRCATASPTAPTVRCNVI